ncbi:MAG TPA: DUF3592 domain-containing protein [Burkholderiales bacterium]|nr:DUF3592 domain-containing protein [Burkholderiales bacterium]
MQPRHLVTTLFGFFVIAAGVDAYIRMGNHLATLRETAAVVVEVVYETATLQKGRMHPVVRFTTEDGRQVTGRSDKHLNVQPGDAVQVLYDPAAPEHVEVRTLAQARRQRIFFSGFAIALGLALSIGAFAVDRGYVRIPEGAGPSRVYRKRG